MEQQLASLPTTDLPSLSTFEGNEGVVLTADNAGLLTRAYRTSSPDSILGSFIGRQHLEAILAQETCVGIRIYYGVDAHGSPCLVLSGADSEESDLVDGPIVSMGPVSPPRKGQNNVLNS
ncbi:hypothetical protein LJY25_17130 [Hymenobacter sp. BT175]|uniref:hypothetical protein n=1 Tax=Hymenobacter translucens TaxID=2886507 RepID=UPI001D0EBAE1|nr:hypothetical protein [Hymenobacter translucens]MCC2548176.1 hypothetical protein [Hymenobacter translucens]